MAFLPKTLPKLLHPDFQNPGAMPVGEVTVDWTNPLSRGLKGAYLLGKGTSDFIPDLTGQGNDITLFNCPPPRIRGGQPCRSFNGTDQYGTVDGGVLGDNPTHATFAVSWRTDVGDSMVFSKHSAAGDIFGPYDSNSSTSLWRAGGVGTTSFTTTQDFTKVHRGIFSLNDPTNQQHLVQNGVLSSTVAEFQIPPAVDGDYLVGVDADATGNGSLGNWFDGHIFYIFMWDRDLTAEECISFDKNPYQVLRPAVPISYLVESVGNAVTATTDALTITDFDVIVQADVATNVSATLDTLTVTDFDTTVQADVDINISATLDTLTITDFDTVVQADVGLNVSATTDTLTITDFDTVVQAGAGTSVNATLDTLTITDFDATVQANVDLNINAALDTLVITDFATTVTTGAFDGIPIDGVEESVITTNFGSKKIYFNGTSYFTY